MQKELYSSRWYDNLWAAFIFFTRLPLWRVYQPPRECYKAVVEWWPLTGWLVGGLTGMALYAGSLYLPWVVAVLLAIVLRLLLTGALHEDGLADFFDGFGGGGADRQRILSIMKDSHIGTYGVLALTAYHLLLAATLCAMAPEVAALAVLAAGPFARMVTAQLVMMLPYARREDEAKARVVYRKISTRAGILLAVQGLLPLAAFLWMTKAQWEWVVFIPCLLMYFLYRLMARRLRGYTGDCCGAVCLLVELAVYVVLSSQNLMLQL